MHYIRAGAYQQFAQDELSAMFRLRWATFKERLDWQVEGMQGEERDEFDHSDTVYILVKSEANDVLGCWRLLPTRGPYMLRDTFPELLHGLPAPCHDQVWELSRFAIALGASGAQTSSFGPLSVALMAESVRYAREHNIVRYVTVTSAPVERLLKRQGVNICRLGPPIRIGQVLTVACAIEIDEVTARALGL